MSLASLIFSVTSIVGTICAIVGLVFTYQQMHRKVKALQLELRTHRMSHASAEGREKQ